MKNTYKLIDLFCGAGGMSLGFTDSRYCGEFTSIFAIDNDKSAIETYKKNFGSSHSQNANIEEWLNNNQIPSADIVVGGPPCQGFSLLNRNRIGDSRRELWEPFMDIVVASNASVFVMENVPGLLKSCEFEDICKRAVDEGFYLLEPAVLNTADYGVPQTRKRAITIGIKISHFDISSLPSFPPKPTHQAPGSNANRPLWRTVKEFIKDLPIPVGTEIRKDEIGPLNLHFGRKPTEVSKQRYRAVPLGGNRFDLQKNRPDITPKCWLNKKSGGTDLFGRLWWDRPSVTIRTEFFKPEKGRYLHPEEHRPITHREAARLMSFPDNFEFCGTKIDIARQIGNAVPPIFAGHIANFVSQILELRHRDMRAA
ncbi:MULTISPECIES: DNA cytosine methyltransferase [Idiomarina]|nr:MULTISPECIES: DNA cytosine methyltransferase [Idiomarina]MBP58792.1 DNA (cytosine-5-)-methyltransferase [Idiomarina sp.]